MVQLIENNWSINWLEWTLKFVECFFARDLSLCQQVSAEICQILDDCLSLYQWLGTVSVSEKEDTISWAGAWVGKAFLDWRDLNSEWFLSPSTIHPPGCQDTFVSRSGVALVAPGPETRPAFTSSRRRISKPILFFIHAAQMARYIHTAHKHNKRQLERDNQKTLLCLLFSRGSGPEGSIQLPGSDLCAGSQTTLLLHMVCKMSKHKNGYWWSATSPLKCRWNHCIGPDKCQKCEGAATA